MRNKLLLAIALASSSLLATPASAAVLYSNPALSTGPLAVPGSAGFSASSSAAQSGSLAFQLLGYASLDGDNAYRDDFTLAVNGTDVLKLSYDLGGGGGNVIDLQPAGTTITGGSAGFFNGGSLNITLPVNLLLGSNNFSFSYAATGPANGGGQGLGDEGFGIGAVSLSAATGAVPEPASWALMVGGFGVLGGAMRRRRNPNVTFA